ncbi:uncharacterized protein TM35_000342260 [Trypanosoma theileri]|uniref:Uncharacterized protein n=1 Tax=Trypanosoma theileri TaxID=67003 RepID=A0A1X0NLJ0_9TRYP|nr:uncharacterized protein TM35_000342260 [Trypanosoma theileri]ORC85614.1 hypothetical protein TM35_000342260 [Trypanosoma theileri]
MTEDTERDPFQAFFESSEESVSAFLRTFTELSAVERALLTLGDPLKLKEETCIDENVNNLSSATMQTLAEAEYFAAAIEAFRVEGQELKSNSNNKSKNDDSDSVLPLLLNNSKSFPLNDVELEEEILVDESVALKTSTMTAFLNYGCTDIVPTFDNFIEGDEIQMEEERDIEGKMEENKKKRMFQSKEMSLYNKDLQTEDINKEKTSSTLDGAVTSPTDAIIGSSGVSHSLEENTVNDTEQHDNCDDSDDGSGDCVSDSELELPGLTTNTSLQKNNGLMERCNIFLSTKDLDVLREVVDDEVRPFELDPYFDYDADLIGAAARQNDTHWRV